MQRQVGRGIQLVEFVIVGFRQVGVTRSDDHMAGSASATAATGMFQMDAEVHGDVQQRLGFPVILKRQLPVFKFDRLVAFCSEIRKCNLRHDFIVASETGILVISPCFIKLRSVLPMPLPRA